MGGAWSRGVPDPRAMPGPKGGLVQGGLIPRGAWSWGRGPGPKGRVPGPGGSGPGKGLVLKGGDPPRDSYCCGWYASYWNAF